MELEQVSIRRVCRSEQIEMMNKDKERILEYLKGKDWVFPAHVGKELSGLKSARTATNWARLRLDQMHVDKLISKSLAGGFKLKEDTPVDTKIPGRDDVYQYLVTKGTWTAVSEIGRVVGKQPSSRCTTWALSHLNALLKQNLVMKSPINLYKATPPTEATT